MKKRSIKQLQLNKKTISTFTQEEVKGGLTPSITWVISKLLCEAEEQEQPTAN